MARNRAAQVPRTGCPSAPESAPRCPERAPRSGRNRCPSVRNGRPGQAGIGAQVRPESVPKSVRKTHAVSKRLPRRRARRRRPAPRRPPDVRSLQAGEGPRTRLCARAVLDDTAKAWPGDSERARLFLAPRPRLWATPTLRWPSKRACHRSCGGPRCSRSRPHRQDLRPSSSRACVPFTSLPRWPRCFVPTWTTASVLERPLRVPAQATLTSRPRALQPHRRL